MLRNRRLGASAPAAAQGRPLGAELSADQIEERATALSVSGGVSGPQPEDCRARES
jgi:hypothetical protein